MSHAHALAAQRRYADALRHARTHAPLRLRLRLAGGNRADRGASKGADRQ